MMRTFLKWMLLSTLSVLGLVLFLVISLEVFISIPSGQRYLKGTVESQLGRALEREVRIGSINTDIFFRVQAREVNISSVLEKSIVPFLNLKQARIRYNILELLRGKVLIRSIDIENMQVNVVTDSTGKTNIPLIDRKTVKKPSASPSVLIEIHRVALSHSTLRYRNRIIPLDVSVTGTEGEATLHGTGYTFRVSADSINTAYKQGVLNAARFKAKGNWDNGMLRLDEASANLPGLTATVNGLAFGFHPDSLLAGKIHLAGNPGEVIAFIRVSVSPGLPDVSGVLDLQAELGGVSRAPSVSAILSAPDILVRDVRLQEGFLRASWTISTARVDSLSFIAFGGTAHGHGTVNTRTFLGENTALVFNGVDVKRLANLALGASPYSGKVSGMVTVAGYLDNPDSLRAQARISVRSPGYQARMFPDITLDATLRNGSTTIGMTGGDARLTAEGRIDGRLLNGKFSATVPQISAFAEPAGIAGLTGDLDGQGIVGGTISAPDVRVTLSGHSIRYRNFPVDTLAGDILWQKKVLSFSDLRAGGNLESISDLRPPLHVDSLSGALRYTGVINGGLDSPRAELSLTLEKPAYRNFRFDTGQVRAVVRGDTLDVSRAVLESDSLRVQASGLLDYRTLKGSAKLELGEGGGGSAPKAGARVSAAFDLKNPASRSISLRGEDIFLPFLGKLAPGSPPVEGTLNFTGAIGGSLNDPEAAMVFTIRKPGFRSAYLDSLRGEISLRNGQVSLQPAELFLEQFRSVLTASLTLEKTNAFFTVTGNSPIRGTLKGDSLQVALVQRLFPQANGKISGTAAFDLAFDGVLFNPHPQGTASVAGFSLTPPDEGPLISGADIMAIGRDDSLTLSVSNGQLLRKPFTIEAGIKYMSPGFGGNVAFSFDGQKALNVSGAYTHDRMDVTTRVEDLNLSILRAFVPALETVSGFMSSSMTFTGKPLDPKPNGFLKIHGLNLDFPGWDMPLRNGVVSLNITPDQVAVDTLFVKIRKGSIRVNGQVNGIFTKPVKGALTASVDNVQVRKKNVFDVTVRSALLSLSGAEGGYLVSGNADMGESKILTPLSIQSLLERLAAPPPPPPPPPPPFMEDVRLDVVVNGGDRLYIQNSLSNIRTRADIEVIGTLAVPNILGTATVVEGNVQYLDRKFTITQGTVQFTSRTEVNPRLDIQAETTVTTYSMFGKEPFKITLSVSGTSKVPTVKMSSDPPLGEPDIISLLTLGVTRDQVGLGSAASDTTTSLQNVLKQRAELLTSQRLAGYLGHEIGGLLGLQNLTVEGNLFNIHGEEGGPRIIASKQISPDVEVTYISTLGRQSDQGIQVNYSVTDTISLRGQTDSQGRSGLDVLFRLRFR